MQPAKESIVQKKVIPAIADFVLNTSASMSDDFADKEIGSRTDTESETEYPMDIKRQRKML